MDKDRRIAYEILFDISKNGAYSNLAINKHLEEDEVKNPGFVRELVYGILENQIYIDNIIDTLALKGLKSIKTKELLLLRMGIYQLKYMNSVPDYAAINETVNLAKKLVRGRERFINGMLRSFVKKAEESDFLPADTDLEYYLSLKYSYKPWIVSLWALYYQRSELEKLLEAGNMRPTLCIRNNISKVSRDELVVLLKEQGISSEISPLTERGILVKGQNLVANEYYGKGYYSVQDVTSIIAADIVSPSEGDKILDVCAAPGGKTLAMAEALKDSGNVLAMDIYPHRLELINGQAERLGIKNVSTKAQDGTIYVSVFANAFDKVLCDVPCSGLGVIRHKPEIKLKDKEDLESLYLIQEQILNNAAKYVKKGGCLVYSTCTINRKENEEQIEKFLDKNDSFEKVFEKQYLPHIDGTDGFYIAKLILK